MIKPRPPRARKLSVTRVLQVALPLMMFLGVGFVAIHFVWLQSAPWGTPRKNYPEFERDVLASRIKKATVDGNIVRAEYADAASAVVCSPNIQRTVDIMLKVGVDVEAAQAVPASGISLPVLCLALLPYPVLAYFALGLIKSVGASADFSATEALLEDSCEGVPGVVAGEPSEES